MNVETAETNLRSHFSSFYNITANNSLLSKTPRKQKQIIILDLNKANGVTFAVRSRGACGRISNMTIYYYYCKEIFVNGARLKKTPSPRNGSKRVLASCPKNSQPWSNLTRFEGYCYRDGSWSMNGDFKCLCLGKYELNKENGCLCKYEVPFIPRYFQWYFWNNDFYLLQRCGTFLGIFSKQDAFSLLTGQNKFKRDNRNHSSEEVHIALFSHYPLCSYVVSSRNDRVT